MTKVLSDTSHLSILNCLPTQPSFHAPSMVSTGSIS